MTDKISHAELLCQDKSDYKSHERGVTILKSLILGNLMTQATRVAAVRSLLVIEVDEAHDTIARVRDSLTFIWSDKKKLIGEVDFLLTLVREPTLSSHERLMTVVCLYNHGFLEYCYDAFAYLSEEPSVLVNYRIEANRYLFHTEDKRYEDVALRSLISIILDLSYPSEYRYNIVASFATTTGMVTMLNFAKLQVEYNEEFCRPLQQNFFDEEENGVRERILSGQHLLQMESVETEYKNNVVTILIGIAENNTHENGVRADAADVVLRLGTPTQRTRAADVIRQLGFDGEQSLLARGIMTAYNDAENIHNKELSESVRENILKIISDQPEQLDDYTTVHAEVTTLIYSIKLSTKERSKAFKALNRISIDTATFTTKNVTIATIFVNVWMRIKKHTGDERNELNKRLIEELITMTGTCGSGHAGRLINVLSYYDLTLRISWKDQIISNTAARMQTCIRNLDDDDMKASVAMGMMKDADEHDKDVYIKFITDTLPIIHKELYREFVGDGYVTEDEFEECFTSATTNWV